MHSLHVQKRQNIPSLHMTQADISNNKIVHCTARLATQIFWLKKFHLQEDRICYELSLYCIIILSLKTNRTTQTGRFSLSRSHIHIESSNRVSFANAHSCEHVFICSTVRLYYVIGTLYNKN